MTLLFGSAPVLSGNDMPDLLTGIGFAVLLVAGLLWLRVVSLPSVTGARLLGLAGGATGVAFIALSVGWFARGLF